MESSILIGNFLMDKTIIDHIHTTYTLIKATVKCFCIFVEQSVIYYSSTVHSVLMPTCSYVTAAVESQHTFMLKMKIVMKEQSGGLCSE